MEEIFQQIRRGGISIMPDYTEYEVDEYGIFISRHSPSILNIHDGMLCDGHSHSGNGCCQLFYYRKYDKDECPDGYTSYEHFLECYMRMVRHPGHDYLKFWWISNALPEDRIDPHTIWYCDRCEGDDNMPEVLRYKCVDCETVDICIECYCTVDNTCTKCGKCVTWMGQSNWDRREILLTHRYVSTAA